MSAPQTSSSATIEPGIPRLIARARLHGEADPQSANRRWIRYTIGMPVELTTDPENPHAAWIATTHNVSGGGIGCWSKHHVPKETTIWLRERSAGDSAAWLPGKVVHASVGLRGHLLGIAFEQPAPPDGEAHAGEDSDRAPPSPTRDGLPSIGPSGSILGSWPLASKIACASALGGAAGALVTGLLSHTVWPDAQPVLVTVLSALVALLLAGILGWAVVRGEVLFLTSFLEAIRQIGKGRTSPSPLFEAPCRELGAVGHAVLELEATWRLREDDGRIQRQRLHELNRIKSNILAIVSHDLRTPLTSILLYAQMLNEELETLADEDQRRFLEIISDESTRLSRLVDDLLEVQRLESSPTKWDIKPQDLAKTIASCSHACEALALSKSIQLHVKCPDSLPPVEADTDKISQVLSNLLSNALKYTPAGGIVWVSAQANSNEVLIRVADNGPGIPRDKWDHIFDRFTQMSDPNVREVAGVGLGLNIVRQIVERHGGRVWVDSEVGKGSEFFVSLPVRAPNSRGESGPDALSAAGRIVVCDASPELAAQISQALRLHNYNVRLSHSGCRLLAQVAGGDTDVVVTDVLLPDMNAAELLDGLNAVTPKTFRLVIHSYAGHGPELRRRGADVYLQRPASKEDLVQAVQVAMRKRSAVGKTVILVEGEGFRTAPLSNLLSNRGHLPITTHTLTGAAEQMHRYLVDAVLVSDQSLLPDWANLEDVKAACEENAGIIVISSNVNRKTRRLADTLGVALLQGRPGDEEEIAAAVTASLEDRILEFIP